MNKQQHFLIILLIISQYIQQINIEIHTACTMQSAYFPTHSIDLVSLFCVVYACAGSQLICFHFMLIHPISSMFYWLMHCENQIMFGTNA